MLTEETRPYFQTLLDALILTAEDDAATAIVFVATDAEPIVVSRAEFRTAVFHSAQQQANHGIHAGDLVIIAHQQNLEGIYAFWGALLIGAVPSMFPTLTEKLDPDIYMRDMAKLVALSGVKAILTSDSFAPVLAEHVDCAVYGDFNAEARGRRGETIGKFTPHAEDIAFLQHSSGTTGLKKGVALAHTAVLNQIASYSDALQLNEQDVVVSWLPLYHDMGLIAGFMLPLIQGIPLVLMSPFDWVSRPALLFRAITEFKGTLCWLPNFAYNHCARRIRKRDKEGISLASMRAFINCSEPVRDDSHQLFLEKFAPHGLKPEMLAVSYAMAENTFGVTQTAPHQPPISDVIDEQKLITAQVAHLVSSSHSHAATKVSCGRPISGTAVKIVDDNGNNLPERHVGHIWVKSNCMLTAYYKRPDLQPFNDGWYETGDKGYLADGELYVNGRTKDLIINAGKNVYPQDLEAIVNEVEGVHAGRAVAFGVPDQKEGTELIAIVAEVKTEDPDERKQISSTIRQTIVKQTAVSVTYVQLVAPKWLIKTSSGKIARAANRDKWLSRIK